MNRSPRSAHLPPCLTLNLSLSRVADKPRPLFPSALAELFIHSSSVLGVVYRTLSCLIISHFRMAEGLPAEALIHFLSNFSWSASAIPNGLPAELELLLHNFQAQRQLQLQIPQLLAAMQIPPTSAPPATLSPTSATSSTPPRSSPRRESRMTSPGGVYDCIRNVSAEKDSGIQKTTCHSSDLL